MTTDELDKFVADSVDKGYDEALVLAGQMSTAIQDVASSNPATFSELVRFAQYVSLRYERVIERRATVSSALLHDAVQDRSSDLKITTSNATLDIDTGHDEGVVLGVETSNVQ